VLWALVGLVGVDEVGQAHAGLHELRLVHAFRKVPEVWVGSMINQTRQHNHHRPITSLHLSREYEEEDERTKKGRPCA
jgi:hypothetical protein